MMGLSLGLTMGGSVPAYVTVLISTFDSDVDGWREGSTTVTQTAGTLRSVGTASGQVTYSPDLSLVAGTTYSVTMDFAEDANYGLFQFSFRDSTSLALNISNVYLRDITSPEALSFTLTPTSTTTTGALAVRHPSASSINIDNVRIIRPA